MGWVTRDNGRRYLYRSRRVNGRVVTEYLGAESHYGVALLESQWKLDRLDRVGRRLDFYDAAARLDRQLRRLARLDRLTADGSLKTVAHGLLAALGYHRPKRGGWRMRRGANALAGLLGGGPPKPILEYTAPAADAEGLAVFAAARAGDADAVAKLPALLKDRGWVEWMGDLGSASARLLVERVARRDPVFRAALQAKVKALREELSGDGPTVLETLLVRRVVYSWLLTHAVEMELATAADPRAADKLDRLLSRSQRRLGEAVRELATVRRLQAPAVLARIRLRMAGDQPALS